MLLFSARRGRPRHERSQHLRIQIERYGLFWMGADDRVSEKIQTHAGHIYRVTLILWLSWFARTSPLARAYAMPADLGDRRLEPCLALPKLKILLM